MMAYNLKSKGRHMSRQRFQRPEVRKMGSGRKQYWGCLYYSYIEQNGVEKRVHKLGRFGLCAKVTKAKAQTDCDSIMATVNSGTVFADGSMTLSSWWADVFKPVRGVRWGHNTRDAYDSTWNVHIEPNVGSVRLADFNKATIDKLLRKLAGAGCGEQLVQRVLVLIHAMLEEAVDNDALPKNPCRKVMLPRCKRPRETRPLTVDEVHRLWGSLAGQDRLVFRTMVLCGLRPNECFALKRDDYSGTSLRIDESVTRGNGFGPPKNGRPRSAPVPASLQAELDAWLKQRPQGPGALLFAAPRGGVIADRLHGREILARARVASKISDLTFRQCRTTFGTLFNGDVKDLQSVMGHHSAAFTMDVYRKPLEARAAAATEDLDARLSNVIPIRKNA